MPGGTWGDSVRLGSYSQNGSGPAGSYDAANRMMLGGGNPTYYGRGDAAVQKRQFANVGKVNLNLLDPLAASRANANYQPIDEGDGGLLGIGRYYSAATPGGLFAGLLGAGLSTVGGVLGEGGAKAGSDVGQFLGKTLEAPLGIVGGLGVSGVPFVTPIIDSANSEIEKSTPYILRDTLKLPTNIGGAFMSMLNVFGLMGRTVERTYAGLGNRGDLPEDIQKKLDSGELENHDQALDELVMSGRGFSNDPMHNLLWSMLTDPANWLSLGVGTAAAGARGTAKVAQAFGAAERAGELVAQGGRLGELQALARGRAPLGNEIFGRQTLAQMRNALDYPDSKLQLSLIEKMGMSALGPVSETTGAAVARVGYYVYKATDPINFFSGSKAGQRSMEQISLAASTGVIAAHGANNVRRLTGLADEIVPGGGEMVMRAIGVQGSNHLQEVATSELVTDAMRSGAVPRTGKLSVTESIREVLRGGGFDTQHRQVRRSPRREGQRHHGRHAGSGGDERRDLPQAGLDAGWGLRQVKSLMGDVSQDEAMAVHALYYYTKGVSLHTDVAKAMKTAATAARCPRGSTRTTSTMVSPRSLTNVTVKAIDAALAGR